MAFTPVNFGGTQMTPWEYNDYARSRENQSEGITSRNRTSSSGGSWGGGGWGGGSAQGSNPPPSATNPNDPYKDIDRSPFELSDKDALVLAQQQRVRDATAYKFNLAGLPQPIEMWSGNVADTQRQNMPLGTVASLMPGTGAFPGSESYRNYALAREAYMGDPIRAAQLALAQAQAQQQQQAGSTRGWTGNDDRIENTGGQAVLQPRPRPTSNTWAGMF